MSWTVHPVRSEMARSGTFAADFGVQKMVDQSLIKLGSQRRWRSHLGSSAQIPELAMNAKLRLPWDATWLIWI